MVTINSQVISRIIHDPCSMIQVVKVFRLTYVIDSIMNVESLYFNNTKGKKVIFFTQLSKFLSIVYYLDRKSVVLLRLRDEN